MKKIIIAFLLFILLAAFLYFYLAIELELKYSIESHGAKTNQLIDSSFRLRTYAQFQIAIFVVMFAVTIFLLINSFKRKME